MNHYLKELDAKRRKFGRVLSLSLLGFFLFFTISLLLLKHYLHLHPDFISSELVLVTFLSSGYICLLLAITDYAFIFTYRILTFSLFCLTLFLSITFCHVSNAVFLLYVPLAIMAYIITSMKKAIISSVFIVLLCLGIPYLSLVWEIEVPQIDQDIMKFLEFLIIVFSTYLSLLTFYYLLEFIKIEAKQNIYKDVNSNSCTDDVKTVLISQSNPKTETEIDYTANLQDHHTEEELEKFKSLYYSILAFYEKSKPYQSADFSIKTLAKELDSNETYVSTALNKIGNSNFSTLTNNYRINQVLEEFRLGNHLKYTIVIIYSKAGFTQQSTFNRIFKKHTGISPTAYIENLIRP